MPEISEASLKARKFAEKSIDKFNEEFPDFNEKLENFAPAEIAMLMSSIMYHALSFIEETDTRAICVHAIRELLSEFDQTKH